MEPLPLQQSRARHPRRVDAARRGMFPEAAGPLLDALRDALCEPTRAKIIRALMFGELTVGDLSLVIGRSQSSTSQHLRVLRSLGLVTSRRRGRVVYNLLSTSAIATAASRILGVVAEFAAGAAPAGDGPPV